MLVHHYRGIGTVTLPARWTEATFSVGSGSTITIFEYEGIDTVSPLDQTASNADGTGTLTICSTGTTPSTTMADELVIAGMGLNGTSGGWGNTWSNGFTQQSTVVSTVSNDDQRSASSTADRIVVATGGYETTDSWTTTRNCQAAIVTFQAP